MVLYSILKKLPSDSYVWGYTNETHEGGFYQFQSLHSVSDQYCRDGVHTATSPRISIRINNLELVLTIKLQDKS